LRWHGLFGRFGDAERDWWAGLADVQVPVLAVSAEGDRQDPPWACHKLLKQFGSAARQYLCLGRKTGFSSDFGHVEMLLSKPAQQEVWPLVEHWLQHQCLPPAFRSPADEVKL
jgi:poly(3-hydroxyalkanoate) synthetase